MLMGTNVRMLLQIARHFAENISQSTNLTVTDGCKYQRRTLQQSKVMRDTTIMSDTGYLGPHSPVLKVGDTQSLIFKDEDSGPWYLSPEEKEQQRHNRPTGKSKRIERSKKMLVDALAAAGVVLQQQQKSYKERADRVCK
jgi:hypothetical protein